MICRQKFNKVLQKLFAEIGIGSKLQLNGSFNNSYWASDIDLYEDITGVPLAKLQKHITKISKSYKVTEIKVVCGSTSKKYEKNPNAYPSTTALVKVDMLFDGLLFPIECSVIFDRNPEATYDDETITQSLVNEISEKLVAGKMSMYKVFKRFNTIAKVKGMDVLFPDINNNTRWGVLYLSSERLKLLQQNDIDNKDKYMQQVQEDLRKIDVHTHDPKEIIALLNKEMYDAMSNNGL